MTNRYKPVSILGKATYGDDVIDLDLSVMDEKDALDGGHLELAPREYRVLSDNYAAGAKDTVVELALLKENEAALIQGGHLQRVADPAKQAPADDKPATKAADKKEK